MISKTYYSFQKDFDRLDPTIQRRAEKAYELWEENPYHPSLQFKCINKTKNIWSVRVTRNIRTLGVWKDDTIVWFWIGNHDEYEQFFGQKNRMLLIAIKF